MRGRAVVLRVACILFVGAASAARAETSPPGFSSLPLLPAMQATEADTLAVEPIDENPSARQAREERERALRTYRESELSSRNAIVMSMVFPGWGQLYADTPFWSVVGFGVQMYYLANILMERRRVERARVLRDAAPEGSVERDVRDLWVQEHKERARDFLWWSAGGFLILSLDAYVSVQLVDFDAKDPPTPDLDRDWDDGEESGEGVALRVDFSF